MPEINSLSDQQLVKAVKHGPNTDACLKELVNRHSGIYVTMVNNYSPPTASIIPSCRNELLSDKEYYIYQAALKYDSSKKTKFSTYLGNETRWLCLNLYNKHKKSKEVYAPNPGETYLASDAQAPLLDQEILEKVMSLIKREPDRRVAKIFKMRYIDGEKNKVMPWNKICKSVNLSIQGCINVHNKAISKIKEDLGSDL